jgi:hypothetical protein
MIMNGESEGIWVEMAMAYFNALSWNSVGEILLTAPCG